MPVTPRAAATLAEMGHDAVHAKDVGLGTAPDADILARAAAEGRVVVTADLDYPRLLATGGASSPGVILIRGGSFSDTEMLGLLDRVMRRAGDLDLPHSIVVVDTRRIRRRRLPV